MNKVSIELKFFFLTLLNLFALDLFEYGFYDEHRKLVKKYYRIQGNWHSQAWHIDYLNHLKKLQKDKYFSCNWVYARESV